jgi:hypothetical protein
MSGEGCRENSQEFSLHPAREARVAVSGQTRLPSTPQSAGLNRLSGGGADDNSRPNTDAPVATTTTDRSAVPRWEQAR